MLDTLSNIGGAAAVVFSPTAGRGTGETIIGVLLVLAFIATIFIPHNGEMDTVLIALVSAIVAFYFGQKSKEYGGVMPPED